MPGWTRVAVFSARECSEVHSAGTSAVDFLVPRVTLYTAVARWAAALMVEQDWLMAQWHAALRVAGKLTTGCSAMDRSVAYYLQTFLRMATVGMMDAGAADEWDVAEWAVVLGVAWLV